MRRHRHQEFIRFFDAVKAERIYVILDSFAAQKHPKV
jgi:hypothetical protein